MSILASDQATQPALRFGKGATPDMDVETIKTASGYLMATFLTTLGLTTIINPVLRSESFGVTARPEDKAILSFIKPMGARDFSVGVTIGMFMFNGDQKNAGLVMLIGLIAPAMDAWSVWTYNGRMKGTWPHIIGSCLAGALGLWLIG